MMTTTEPLLLRSEVKKEESELHHHHHHMCGMDDCSPADSSLYSPTTTGLQLEVIYPLSHALPLVLPFILWIQSSFLFSIFSQPVSHFVLILFSFLRNRQKRKERATREWNDEVAK